MTEYTDPLDLLIKETLEKEMSKIEVPSVDEAWSEFVKLCGIKQRRPFWRSKLTWAVAALLIAAMGVFYQPATTVAFGNNIVRSIQDFFTGQTTKNRQITYSPATQPQVPVVKNLGPTVDKEVTLAEAEKIIPYPIASPSYLPEGAVLNKVLLMQSGPMYRLTLQYGWQQKNLTITEQNIVGQMSIGRLYDTDDTKIKDIEVNGSKEQLFEDKNGDYNLIWQIRGLHLELQSNSPETELMDVVKSIS